MNLNWDRLGHLADVKSDFASQIPPMIAHEINNCDDDHSLSQFLSTIVDNEWGEQVAKQFQSWREHPNTAPTLGALLLGAVKYFDIKDDNPFVPIAMGACLLGGIKHNNPYHSNPHFREVMCIILKLCAMHNEISGDTPLVADDILLLIATAAIHDFGHDGLGNTNNGVYEQSRMELKTLSLIKPFFEALKISDSDFQKMEMMVLCTDVTRDDRVGKSRAVVARDIYMAHYHDNVSVGNVSDIYKPLLGDSKLSLMTILLCEADIAMSSSLDYRFSKLMTQLVAEESSQLKPNAATLYNFMEVICHGGFLTRASQVTLGQNFQAILLQAEQDSEENRSFTKPKPKGAKFGVLI